MVGDDFCFTAIGGKDFCGARFMSRLRELLFMISSSRAVIFGLLVIFCPRVDLNSLICGVVVTYQLLVD